MPSLVSAFTTNWKLKLLAFTLAVLLWIVVSAEEVTSRWIDIPLQVRVTDPEYMLVPGSVPNEVAVRFSGPRRELIDLRFRRPPLVLNILDVEDTQQSFALQAQMVQLPTQLSVNVVDMQPSDLNLNFTRVETRSYPVRVRLAEPIPSDWVMLDTLMADPARIRVTGTEARLAGVDSIYTLPMALPGTDTSFSVTLPIDTTELQGLRLSARAVELSGRFDRIAERTFAGIPVSVGPGVVIRPATVEVALTGPSSRLAPLSPSRVRVVISIDSIPSQIPDEGVRVPLRVDGLPAGVSAQVSPDGVTMFPGRAVTPTRDTIPGDGTGESADTTEAIDAAR